MGSLSDAACVGSTALFFPDEEDEDYEEQIAAAQAVCATCPVREACAELGQDEEYGVWGGTSPEQRRHLRTEKGQEQCQESTTSSS